MRIVSVSESNPGIAYRCPGPRGTARERYLDRHEVILNVDSQLCLLLAAE